MSKLFVENVSGSIKPAADGSYPIVLISPGQGSSGYYREEVIRDYAPQAFPSGTHVYLDHLKEGETRSPEKLLGTLIEDTTVNENGEAVNRFRPISKHAAWIEEVRPYVGLSVAVRGDGTPAEIEGRQTLMVESLESHITNTVDVVSYAGRGGRFLESFLEEANSEDAQRTHATPAGTTEGNKQTMTISEEQVTALVESVERLVAAISLKENAGDNTPSFEDERAEVVVAVRAVESADISDATKARLIKGITEDGNLDVAEAIEAEKTLREEIRAEFKAQTLEEAGASASAGNADLTDVKGW